MADRGVLNLLATHRLHSGTFRYIPKHSETFQWPANTRTNSAARRAKWKKKKKTKTRARTTIPLSICVSGASHRQLPLRSACAPGAGGLGSLSGVRPALRRAFVCERALPAGAENEKNLSGQRHIHATRAHTAKPSATQHSERTALGNAVRRATTTNTRQKTHTTHTDAVDNTRRQRTHDVPGDFIRENVGNASADLCALLSK